MIKIAMMVGSLRQGSYNMMLARHMQNRYQDRLEIDIINIDLPLFNDDHNKEENRPSVVRAFHEKIEAADAIIFVSPEYNHATSGVLKNAIDWGSRPAKGTKGLNNKVALITTASTGKTAGARAYVNLLAILNTMAIKQLPGHEIMLSSVHTLFDEYGTLSDQSTVAFIDKVIDAFIEYYNLVK